MKLAREIEGDVKSQNQVELENGNEEEAFSAVVRPASSSNGPNSSQNQLRGPSGVYSNIGHF